VIHIANRRPATTTIDDEGQDDDHDGRAPTYIQGQLPVSAA
jgi:hypothetical protein